MNSSITRCWDLLTREERKRVILEAMTHIRNNHIYAERYAHTCTVTFVASVVPMECGIGVANTVHSHPNSPLQIACLVPNSNPRYQFFRDPRCAEMVKIFRNMAHDWYLSRDVELPAEESDKDFDEESSDGSLTSPAPVSEDNWRDRRLALIKKGLSNWRNRRLALIEKGLSADAM
ncbi:hypothetical protein SISSUDRAFT_1038662 [Sistotremastrum suecicum HHB10207 ss-3]|uniref:Uncharacterized protein n=1 Tax=Sistotremastrum suecicum HHB10207 ss-3 TaxID=1314776 RepID=A0A165WH07_9AGAM|nr:hypothetical protein SISSUDRAFT_1038662 [Sistotremastrum suecicum HHB10207 ss-3]